MQNNENSSFFAEIFILNYSIKRTNEQTNRNEIPQIFRRSSVNGSLRFSQQNRTTAYFHVLLVNSRNNAIRRFAICARDKADVDFDAVLMRSDANEPTDIRPIYIHIVMMRYFQQCL